MVGTMAKIDDSVKKKVPELRFAGFTDDWEERKLKELGEIQTGNTPPTSDSDNYSLDGVLWVTPTDIKSLVISNTAKKLSQVGVTKARIAKAGSILVTSIASIGKNTLLRMDAGFNQQINSLTPTSENDSYFLLTQSEKWSEKMKQTAASATMQIVNKTDFSNISTYVPLHKEEQEKIGSFFKQLDDTITLHQRKLDLLKEQKKGYLQKMFPKNGAKVPELRFAGFADDWEERKLGKVLKKDTLKNKDLEFHYKDIISVAQMKKATVVRDSSDSYMTTYNKIRFGNIAFEGHANKEFPNGRFVLNDFRDGIVSHIYDVYSFIEKSDSNFMKKYINNPIVMRKILINSTSNARMMNSLNSKEFLKQNLILPTFEEQAKIGSFLKQLDDTIALHQRKLDLLKEQKKGFLQKMFV